jgi:FAD/FMN-containing dehydrogenase
LPGFSDSFYSTHQRLVIPACILTPESPQEVSQAILIIRQHSCIFAVKSGGHATFVGASNAPSGITIDLRKLNTIEISEDQETTIVGSGNRWKEVYEKLEPFNLTVAGGRNPDVGVGGFILGGENIFEQSRSICH